MRIPGSDSTAKRTTRLYQCGTHGAVQLPGNYSTAQCFTVPQLLPDDKHCTHGAVRTQSDWSTAQCASAREHSSTRAQARALQGTSGRTIIRTQQDTF